MVTSALRVSTGAAPLATIQRPAVARVIPWHPLQAHALATARSSVAQTTSAITLHFALWEHTAAAMLAITPVPTVAATRL